MIITKSPELRQQIFNNIRNAVVKERTGIHLSDLLFCSRKAYFRKLGLSLQPSDELCLLWLTGYAFQAYLFPKDEETSILVGGITYNPNGETEVTIDGIVCTPDILSGIEVKSTRQSMRKFAPESMSHWTRQILGYCKALGKLEYDLVVMFVCGCLSPETLVLQYDLTWTPAGMLRVGDEIVGVDEYWTGRSRRKLRKAIVLQKQVIKLPCSKIVLSNGRVITSSNEHLWLEVLANSSGNVSPEWRTTSELRVGSRIRKLCDVWNYKYDFETGYLAGSLDSEGDIACKRRRTGGSTFRIGYSQKVGKTLIRVFDLLERLGISLEVRMSKDSKVCRIRTTDMQSTLKVLGSIRPERLLSKVKLEGMGLPMTRSTVEVIDIQPVGEQEVIGLDTSTKTLIAEGLVSHNSYAPPFPDVDCWHIIATEEEVENNWQRLLIKAVKLEMALNSGVPPEPDCMDWECSFCENIGMCQDFVGAQQAMRKKKLDK